MGANLEHRHPARDRLRGRPVDIVRVLAAGLFAGLTATARRLTGRGVGHGWGWGYEVLVAAARGTYTVMPRIGIVRWRNAFEGLLPLLTDGLEPRFVGHDHEPRPLDAAWLEPPGASDAVILYFHGGGYCIGSLRTNGPLIGGLARASGARALAVDYRLAPEHPLPAAFEDALSAWRYLLDQGIPANRIVFAGDSAGGNLVLATLLALRDAGGPMPAAAAVLSPGVDQSCEGTSFETNAPFDHIQQDIYRFCMDNALPVGADPRSPAWSPLFADLTGLPPLLVQTGSLEVLTDPIQALAARAKAAGVDVKLSVYADMVHVFQILVGLTPDAQKAIDEIGAFVRQHTQAP